MTIRGGRIIQLQSTEGAGSSYRNPGGRSTEHVGKHSAASAHIEEITTAPDSGSSKQEAQPASGESQQSGQNGPSALHCDSGDPREQEQPSSESAHDAPSIPTGGSDMQGAHLPVSEAH